MTGYGFLPDEEPDMAAIEAGLRNYLEGPQAPRYAPGQQVPPMRPRPTNYLDMAGQEVYRALGPHLSQSVRNFLELTPPAALRDYQREGKGVVQDFLGGDWQGAAGGVPLAAMALMGIGNPAGRAAAAGKKAWRAPTAEGPYPRTWHGTPHEFPPVKVVRDKETGEVLHVAKSGEEIPRDAPWSNRDVAIEQHPHGRFDWSKMGTGEGAQAFGVGHYTAEAQGVAKSYREALARNQRAYNTIDGERLNAKRVEALRWPSKPGPVSNFYKSQRGQGAEGMGDIRVELDEAIAQSVEQRTMWRQRLKDHLARPPISSTYGPDDYKRFAANEDREIRALRAHRKRLGYVPEKPGGALYEVTVKAKPGEILDLDAPISSLSPNQRKALRDAGLDEESLTLNGTVSDMLRYRMQRIHGDPEVMSKALRAAGIKAVRFKDQMSRQAQTTYKGKSLGKDDSDAKYIVSAHMQAGDTPAEAIALAKKQVAKGEMFDAEDMLKELNAMSPDDWAMKKGTHNYIALDDDVMEILAKYGLVGTLGAGAAAAGGFLGVSETPTGA